MIAKIKKAVSYFYGGGNYPLGGIRPSHHIVVFFISQGANTLPLAASLVGVTAPSSARREIPRVRRS